MKILLIVALFTVLFYLLSRRFLMKKETAGSVKPGRPNGFALVGTSPQLFARATRSTLWTVSTGILLLFIILFIGIKIKILWIALPLCFYLIGQLFVYINHVKTVRNQQLYYDPISHEVWINYINDSSLTFNLLKDIKKISEVKSVQKNRGILYGYYRLQLAQGKAVIIPYLVEQHQIPINQSFFHCLNHHYKIEVETRLFPII